jgi:hypothetical protein
MCRFVATALQIDPVDGLAALHRFCDFLYAGKQGAFLWPVLGSELFHASKVQVAIKNPGAQQHGVL